MHTYSPNHVPRHIGHDVASASSLLKMNALHSMSSLSQCSHSCVVSTNAGSSETCMKHVSERTSPKSAMDCIGCGELFSLFLILGIFKEMLCFCSLAPEGLATRTCRHATLQSEMSSCHWQRCVMRYAG